MKHYVALAVFAAAVWAGGMATSASATSKPESCALLRAKEISEALTQPASKAAPSSVPEVCDWRLDSTATRPIGSVHTLVQRGSVARRSYALAADFHADDREPLAGLGRKAFYAPSLGAVWVLEDTSTVFYVQGVYPTGSTLDAADLRDALVRLAGRAEARL